MTLRLPATATILLGHLLADDGEDLVPGPEVTPMTVPLADLKGCVFYDHLLANLHEFQAAQPTEEESPDTPPPPNRAARRAKPKTNGAAK